MKLIKQDYKFKEIKSSKDLSNNKIIKPLIKC